MIETDSRAEARDKIFGTLQLSNDIYRNAVDADFADQGGEIIYCFDSTVFPLFYDTTKWQSTITSFEQRNHAIGDRGTRELKAIETQAAIVASEYLLSESLPGVKNKNIYLTPWHRRELALSLQAVIRDIKSNTRSDVLSSNIRKELELKLQFLKQVEEQAGTATNRQLTRDLQKLEKHQFGHTELTRYVTTRLAADVLMKCPITETFDQIHRMLSPPLSGRIKSMHSLLAPNEEDLRDIREDAIQWFWRITAEIKRRADRGGIDRRSDESRWSDARSLAYLRWASKFQYKDNRRIVLVTSDDLLFDTYRRWWVSLPEESPESDESFLLRRTFQYAPIFNLSDTSNDLHRSGVVRADIQGLFLRIREAVELQLLPFNLANLRGAEKKELASTVLRAREYLAMRTLDSRFGEDDVLDYFMRTLKSDWYDSQRKTLHAISRIWRDIQRMSIGFFYDKITRRFEDDRFIFGLDRGEKISSDAGEKILAFFRKSFDVLTSRTRSVWVPAAIEFLMSPAKDISSEIFDRVPRTVWFKLPGNQSAFHRVTQWSESGDSERRAYLEDVERQPESVFVLACLLAVQKNDLLKAEEFANYAATTAKEHGTSETLWEINFLSALIKRFRMGSSAANFERMPDGMNSMGLSTHGGRLFTDALTLLDDSIEYYQSDSVVKPQLVRAHSERAALQLFRALAIASFDGESEEFSAISELVEADIEACFELSSRLAGSIGEEFLAVQRQFTHNAAAIAVLKFLARPHAPLEPRPWHDEVTMFLLGDNSYIKPNSALNAERLAFLILVGAVDPIELPRFEMATSAGFSSSLAADRQLAKLLHLGSGAIFNFSDAFDANDIMEADEKLSIDANSGL